MKRRSGFMLFAAALLAGTLSGCSGGNNEGESVQAENGKEKSINVLVEAGSPAYDVAQKTAAEFEESTGIRVQIDAVPYSGMYDKLSAEVTSQTGLYDVACVDTVWLAGLKNGLLPLDQIMDEERKKDFPDSLITDGTLEGEIYGLPAWANCKVLLYREDLFSDPAEKSEFKKKYGYELNVPSNWKEYEDAAAFFTRDEDQDGVMDLYGTSLSAKTGGDTVVSFLDMAAQAGGKPLVMDEEHNVLLDQRPYIDALEHMKTLYDSKAVPSGIFEMAAADHIKLFCEGKLAMAPVWCAMYANAVDPKGSKVADHVGVAVMPAGPKGIGIVPAPFYHVVMKGSKHQEEALKYLEFINDRNELYIARGMAGRISVLEAGKAENPQLAILLESMQASLSSGRPKLAQWNEIESAMNEMIQHVLKGEKMPEEALKELKAEIEAMF